MKPFLATLLGATLLFPTATQAQVSAPDTLLRFDAQGWITGPPGTFYYDSAVVHGGRVSARLARDTNSANRFSAFTKRLPIEFGGKFIELKGFLRTEGVKGAAGLWLREDGPSGPVQFDNMQGRPVTGNTDWTEYTIKLPLDATANMLFVGVLLSGEGKVWADGLQLRVDGKPIDQAPRRTPTIMDTDQEFAGGSHVDLATLSPAQADNLALLGRVWGFLKYHHPSIADGKTQWDFELFRALPGAVAAPDRAALQRTLAAWVEKVGVPTRCGRCAESSKDVALRSNVAWIQDTTLLGAALSRDLQAVYKYRFAGDQQFYVAQAPQVRNPVFDREMAYQAMQPPDAGFRVLALFRLWNIVEYWYPNREITGEDWRLVLRDELPRIVAASTWDAYRLEMMALIARVHDTHANLWGSLDVRPPRGTCAWPVTVRFIEGRPTVTGLTNVLASAGSGMVIGDEIKAIDGHPVDSLIAAWLPYYAASNRPTQLRDLGNSMPKGDCGPGTVTVDRRGQSLTVQADRTTLRAPASLTHDRAGETFQLLSPEVAYLKLSTVSAAAVPSYLSRATGTRGLIIDIRNYPKEFVVFALGGYLVSGRTAFARFTVGDLQNPGTFTWTDEVVLEPRSPAYGGKVVVLVDEVSQSQAEYTTMAFRAAGAVVIGSTTAGADGNISPIPLPGGLRTMISGIGVFYPDKKPTQRLGIVPDIVVTPTIAGIRDDRDEVLEAAVRHILGANTDPAVIRKMTGR